MDIIKACKALSSDTRLNILRILVNKRLSAAGVYREYSKSFRDQKHRESIYRALEKLVDAEVLEKEYNKDAKEIVYVLRCKQLIIDLINQKIITERENI